MLKRQMLLLVSLNVLLSIGAGCASQKSAAGDAAATTGLLLLGARTFEMDNSDKLTPNAAVLNGLDLKRLSSGDRFHFYFNKLDHLVAELPPGDYCVDEFQTYENENLKFCKKPTLTIKANEVLNVGYLIVGIHYDNSANRSKVAVFDAFVHEQDLIDSLLPIERTRISTFVSAATPKMGELANTT